jgi:hypothetical protein
MEHVGIWHIVRVNKIQKIQNFMVVKKHFKKNALEVITIDNQS